MRVLFCSRRFFPAISGMSVYAQNLLRHLVAAGHDVTMVSQYRADPAGVILTFVVDDVDAVHTEARRLRLPLVAPPRDLFHGRRQMLVTDPNGMLVEISSPSTPSPAFTAEMARQGRAPGRAPETTG